MAFVFRPEDEKERRQTGLSGAGSAMAGTGGGGAGNVQSKRSQPAGGGFYNIGDFLSANQGQGQQIANVMQNKANERIGEQAGKVQEAIGSLSDVAPVQQAYDPTVWEQGSNSGEGINFNINGNEYTMPSGTKQFGGSVTEDEYETIAAGLNQAPVTYADITQQIPDYAGGMGEDISKLNAQDFGGLMGFMGEIKDPSAQYTPGMSKLDELLLRGSPDAAQGLISNVQNQWQSQYADPLAQARESRLSSQDAANAAILAEQEKYQTGLSDYLEREKQKVADILARQQAEQAAVGDLPTLSELQTKWNTRTGLEGLGLTAKEMELAVAYGIDPRAFRKTSGGLEPSEMTAVGEYGQGQMYNNLANLLAGKTGDTPQLMAPGTSEQWSPKGIDFQQTEFRKALTDAHRAATLARHQKSMANYPGRAQAMADKQAALLQNQWGTTQAPSWLNFV